MGRPARREVGLTRADIDVAPMGEVGSRLEKRAALTIIDSYLLDVVKAQLAKVYLSVLGVAQFHAVIVDADMLRPHGSDIDGLAASGPRHQAADRLSPCVGPFAHRPHPHPAGYGHYRPRRHGPSRQRGRAGQAAKKTSFSCTNSLPITLSKDWLHDFFHDRANQKYIFLHRPFLEGGRRKRNGRSSDSLPIMAKRLPHRPR